jgi:hypothetical protein
MARSITRSIARGRTVSQTRIEIRDGSQKSFVFYNRTGSWQSFEDVVLWHSMTADQIRTFSDATPFVPFRVHTASGKWVDVPHPDFMHLSPSGRRLIVDKADDTFEVIDVLLVTSVETLSRDGSRRRRGKKSSR